MGIDWALAIHFVASGLFVVSELHLGFLVVLRSTAHQGVIKRGISLALLTTKKGLANRQALFKVDAVEMA